MHEVIDSLGKTPGDRSVNKLHMYWQIDEPGIFSDISLLKNRPAHIAVFLHYLLSNRDPSSLVSILRRLMHLLDFSLSLVAFYPQCFMNFIPKSKLRLLGHQISWVSDRVIEYAVFSMS